MVASFQYVKPHRFNDLVCTGPPPFSPKGSMASPRRLMEPGPEMISCAQPVQRNYCINISRFRPVYISRLKYSILRKRHWNVIVSATTLPLAQLLRNPVLDIYLRCQSAHQCC